MSSSSDALGMIVGGGTGSIGVVTIDAAALNGRCGCGRWMTMGAGALLSEGRAGKEGWWVSSLDVVAVNG